MSRKDCDLIARNFAKALRDAEARNAPLAEVRAIEAIAIDLANDLSQNYPTLNRTWFLRACRVL